MPPNAEVVVFTGASQVKEQYEVVGIISYDNPGKYQVPRLGDAIRPLKTKAREIERMASLSTKIFSISCCVGATGATVAPISVPTSTKNSRYSWPRNDDQHGFFISSIRKEMRDVFCRVNQTSWAIFINRVTSLKA
jgi:hypothetical protein